MQKRWMLISLILPVMALAAQPQQFINRQRLTDLFVRLVQIDSGAENEAEICQLVADELRKLGAEVVEIDNASKKLGGTGGNVFARFKGTTDAPPILLSAHLDTVSSTKGIKLVLEKDAIKTDGTTILGSDDKAGVALILEAIRVLKEHNLPHPPLEIVFTIREEKGLLGAKAFDKSRLKARYGLIVDGVGEPNELIVASPTHVQFEVTFHGKAAHAGVEPEKGNNAIVMAAKAIASLQWGRLDDETTANVGVIEGGKAMNIVPDRCKLIGEFRSHDPKKVERLLQRWKEACEQAANGLNGKVNFRAETTFEAVRLSADEPIVKAAVEAIKELGMTPQLKPMGGGTDGNIFITHGIRCLVFPTGGEDIHSPKERLILPNFYRCGEILVRTLMKLSKSGM